ncbi:hypothetical protein DLAC_05895 [Tieghemostelium lacteum]|uniref:DUF5679 domain-containing protein n=1 Tax=Tieghemostelium lacteum TaxID=361077 RepID=A0A151ZH58_TIELA|nr:hypothetical protein DLAC_05895 [Tieghemostelium lacteum]|eukprot:KYQ93245.1 hypothetical protein DLAC_05895 [Tieghemostelium lacteum]
MKVHNLKVERLILPNGVLKTKSISSDLINSTTINGSTINFNSSTGFNITSTSILKVFRINAVDGNSILISTQGSISILNSTASTGIIFDSTKISLTASQGNNIQLISPNTNVSITTPLTQISGQVSIGAGITGGVKFLTSSIPLYSPSSLNCYEEYSNFMDFEYGSESTVTVKMIRKGKIVHLFLPLLTFVASTTNSACIGSWVNGWPTRFLPENNDLSSCGSYRVVLFQVTKLCKMSESYCVVCKKKTKDIDPKEVILKNGRKAIKSKCAVCGRTKFRFI